MIRMALLTGCTFATAGCSGGIAGSPPAGPLFDGIYAGQDVLQSGVAFQCGDQNLTERVEVRGGQFAYPFQVNPPRTAPLPVQVAADGTVFGQMQYGFSDDLPFMSRERIDWVTLRGNITGPTLDAMITNLRCVRRLVAQRVQ